MRNDNDAKVTDYEYLKCEDLSAEEILKRLREECPCVTRKVLSDDNAFDFVFFTTSAFPRGIAMILSSFLAYSL